MKDTLIFDSHSRVNKHLFYHKYEYTRIMTSVRFGGVSVLHLTNYSLRFKHSVVGYYCSYKGNGTVVIFSRCEELAEGHETLVSRMFFTVLYMCGRPRRTASKPSKI